MSLISRFVEYSSAVKIDTSFPHLTKLCTHFGLRIIHKSEENNDKYYLVADGEGEMTEKLTPVFPSKAELEHYAEINSVDILHRYLGEEQPLPPNSFYN